MSSKTPWTPLRFKTRGITSAALGVSRAFRLEADVATARRRAPRLGRGARAQLGKADCGGLRDETDLPGHNETWKDAHPGMILRELRRLGSRDPVFVLDGVDKLGRALPQCSSRRSTRSRTPASATRPSSSHIRLSGVLFITRVTRLDAGEHTRTLLV